MNSPSVFRAMMGNKASNNVPSGTPSKPKKPRGTNTKFTDEQILEARALREFHGWKPRDIAKKLGMTRIECYRYLSYTVAVHLIPKKPE